MGTLLKLSTKLKRMPGSGGAGVELVRFKRRNDANTAWIDCPFVKRRNATNDGWIWELSMPSGTLSGGGGSAASGASSGGRAQVSVTANPGGVHSGDLSYSWGGGNGTVNYTGAASQVLTGYYDFTGVANGTTSPSRTDPGIFCDIKDNQTGAVWRTDPIVVGPLTWTNTIPAFSPHTNTYGSGSGTEYVPTGAGSLTIRRVGGGGGGGNAIYQSGPGIYKGGNGGGSGAYTSQTIAISPSDWGAPIYWTVGGGSTLWPNIGGTSSTTGSLTAGSVSGTAVGGAGGASGAQSVSGAGVGGSPNGNNGTGGGNDSAGSGGASPYGGYGKGGNGSATGGGAPGGGGAIIFEWGT